MVLLLPDLFVLVVGLVAFALALICYELIKALINAMGGVPIIGRAIGAILSPVARALSWAAGQIEHGVDAAIGWSLHKTAELTEWFWRQFVSQSVAILHLAEIAGNQLYGLTGLRGLVHGVIRTVHGIEAGIKTIERQWHGIEHRVKALEGDVAHGIGADVLPRLRTLEREVTTAETKTIPAIRGIANTAENDVTQLRDWITKNVPLAGTVTFVGVVAWALSQLGLGGLRCDSLIGKNGLLTRRTCGLWNGLEDLLGLFVDALILTDLCAILPEAVTFFGYVEGALTGLISQAAAAVCSLPNQKWTTVTVAAGPRPPAQAFETASLPPDV